MTVTDKMTPADKLLTQIKEDREIRAKARMMATRIPMSGDKKDQTPKCHLPIKGCRFEAGKERTCTYGRPCIFQVQNGGRG